jgi:hypothetical protein
MPGQHVTVAQYHLEADSANIILTHCCFKVVKGQHSQEVH